MVKTAVTSPKPPSRAGAVPRLPARERLLAAAEQLFYEEGFNSVGIDRVIEVAGVAKASLYDAFGSKDELIKAYLSFKLQAKKVAVEEELARHEGARAKLLAVFSMQAQVYRKPGYSGCHFVKASSESGPGSSIRPICDEWRAWIHALFTGLAAECGVPRPDSLAHQLVMLYDGASVSARMDAASDTADLAMATAAALLDVALAMPKAERASSVEKKVAARA